MQTSDFSLFYITCPNQELARQISKVLLEERLIACANIIPQMESHYWWQGKLQSSNEAVLVLKSRKSLKAQIQNRIEQIHSYETPCILEIPIQSGNDPYLKWLASSLL